VVNITFVGGTRPDGRITPRMGLSTPPRHPDKSQDLYELSKAWRKPGTQRQTFKS